jgi:hypothetical protein
MRKDMADGVSMVLDVEIAGVVGRVEHVWNGSRWWRMVCRGSQYSDVLDRES